MQTESHRTLIAELEGEVALTEGGRALLACLRRLRDGGPTEWHRISVDKAWPIEGGFCLVYRWDDSSPIGLRITRESASHPTLSMAQFGEEVADFSVAEPLGTIRLTESVDGIGWWGEPPFP